MSEEFEDRDLTGAVFWGVLLRNAMFRDVDLTGTRTHHVFIDDVEIDGFVDGLIVNGVDVTDYVNQHDPWQPLRGMLRPTSADDIRTAWAAVRAAWDQTLEVAETFPEEQRLQRVDGEWSFLETMRHLVFVTDKWFSAPLTSGAFQPLGLPNSGSVDFPWPGIDSTVSPTYHDVLATRQAQHDAIDRTLAELTDAQLDAPVEVPENGTVAVLDCWHTLLEEEFEHRRYALRDIARLEDGRHVDAPGSP